MKIIYVDVFCDFGGQVFLQIFGVHMGTNYAQLLADLILYSYKAMFLQGLLYEKERGD